MKLALKIDVDTLRGTREGVPRLVELLRRHQAGATFLFSLGPDHTGRAIKRVFRRGFLGKVQRTSVVEHYGIKTLLYGTVLPGPDIGKSAAAEMRAVRDAGFECGIHCWDHVRWQDGVAVADESWARAEMQKAVTRYTEIFGVAPRTHGAAGWQMNAGAYRLESQFGFAYASDARGSGPFVPVVEGREIPVPQLPTTLPTLDELIGIDSCTAANVHEALLAHTEPRRDHVFTLHAELEGAKLLPVFERLLEGWRGQGYELVATAGYFATLDPMRLPRYTVTMGEVPGRSGLLAVQGAAA